MAEQGEKDAVDRRRHDRPRVGRHPRARQPAAALVGATLSTPASPDRRGLWVLYPSWPWGTGYLGGLLRYNERVEFEQRRPRPGRRRRSGWTGSPRPTRPRSQADPELLPVRAWPAARSLQDQLRSLPWRWVVPARASSRPWPTTTGSGAARSSRSSTRSATASATASDPEARDNAMPAFGADGMLTRRRSPT